MTMNAGQLWTNILMIESSMNELLGVLTDPSEHDVTVTDNEFRDYQELELMLWRVKSTATTMRETLAKQRPKAR